MTAPLLLIVGGVVLLVAARIGRPGLDARLRAVDGLQGRRRRERGGAVLAVLAVLALAAAPVAGVAVVARPWGAVLTALLAAVVVPVVVTFVSELVVAVRGAGLAPHVPFVMPWQRRLAKALAGAAAAPVSTPTLRRTRPDPRDRAVRHRDPAGHRLLVVRPPEGRETVRLWEVADRYLRDRGRVHELIELNPGHRGAGGPVATEDTELRAGSTIVVPPDARGPGLVELPGGTGPGPGS